MTRALTFSTQANYHAFKAGYKPIIFKNASIYEQLGYFKDYDVVILDFSLFEEEKLAILGFCDSIGMKVGRYEKKEIIFPSQLNDKFAFFNIKKDIDFLAKTAYVTFNGNNFVIFANANNFFTHLRNKDNREWIRNGNNKPYDVKSYYDSIRLVK